MTSPFPWEVFTRTTANNPTDTINSDAAANWPIPAPNTKQPLISLLKSYRLLEVKGPDAEKFMQGQFTCDISKITTQLSGIGACCNNKGRMLAVFRIAKLADQHFLLRLPAAVAATLAEHLSKYTAFFNCTCSVNPQWACIGYFGNAALLLKIFPELPQLAYEQTIVNKTVISKSSAGSQHFELWLHSDCAQQTGVKLAQICSDAPENLWNLAEITTGTGEIYRATLGEFIPQMFNLQVLEGISFKKGCYTGQEIVARMQYLGKLKKRLYLLNVEGQHINVADTVYCENHKVGSIVRTEQETPLKQLSLAVLDSQVETINSPLWIGDQQSAKAVLSKLPYSLPELESLRPKN